MKGFPRSSAALFLARAVGVFAGCLLILIARAPWNAAGVVTAVAYGSRLQPLAAVKCRSHSWARISEKNHRALLALRGAMSTHAVEQFAEQVHGMAAVCGNLPALRGGGNEDAHNGSAVDCQNAAHIQSGDEGQEYPGVKYINWTGLKEVFDDSKEGGSEIDFEWHDLDR